MRPMEERRLMKCVSVVPDEHFKHTWIATLKADGSRDVKLRSMMPTKYLVGAEYWVTFQATVERVEPAAVQAA